MKLPRFFDVDGILVKFEKGHKTDEFLSISEFGTPFPFEKAIEEGIEISYAEFNKLMNNKLGKTITYPRYFEIRGKVIKVEINNITNKIKALTTDGISYPISQLKNGRELTKIEYDSLNKILYQRK